MEASSKNTIGVHTPPRFVSKLFFVDESELGKSKLILF